AADDDDLSVGCGRGPDRFATRLRLGNDVLPSRPLDLPELLAGIAVEGPDGLRLPVWGFGDDDAIGEDDRTGIALPEFDAPGFLQRIELVGKRRPGRGTVAVRSAPLRPDRPVGGEGRGCQAKKQDRGPHRRLRLRATRLLRSFTSNRSSESRQSR